MKKVLSGVYREIVSLSNVISAVLKGEEPNMQALLGEPSPEDEHKAPHSDELAPEDLETLSTALNTIRTNLCDYYADKYSNECNVQ